MPDTEIIDTVMLLFMLRRDESVHWKQPKFHCFIACRGSEDSSFCFVQFLGFDGCDEENHSSMVEGMAGI